MQTIIFRAKSEVSYRPWENWDFKTRNSYVYQEFGQQKADEDILSLNFLSFKPKAKVFPLALVFVSTNFRRQIELRALLGAGITVKIFEKEKDWLKFSVTSEYERTNFATSDFNRSEYDGSTSINTFRGTVWVNVSTTCSTRSSS